MRRKLLALLVVFIIASMVVSVAGCKKPAGVIKIGVAGPMGFVQGEHHWLGAELAVEEINQAGGVTIGGENYLLELVKVDTNELLSVEDAAAAVERAITVDKVEFIVGTIRTEAALAMQEVAMDYEKVFIVCGASHTQLADKVAADYDRYKYWFRVTPINVGHLVTTSLLLLNHVGGVVREELGVAMPKVAVVIEKAVAGDPLAAAANQVIPTFGMEVVGTWRPSDMATDMTAELTAIRNSGAHIIYTYFSAAAGVTYAKQWGEQQIPAASVGINVEAQSEKFWDATGGFGNYEFTLNTLGRVKITEKTIPYYDKFMARSGQFPTYNAGTYDAIYIWKEAAERAGSLESDAIVVEMENTSFSSSSGLIEFDDKHDVKWGPGFVTAVGTQWQDGELVVVWPYGWAGITYEGTVEYKLPPWMTGK